MNEITKELCLMLIYITGWEEESNRIPGKKIFKSWSAYSSDVLENLEDEELIIRHWNVKTLILTEAGKEKAKKLKKKYKLD